MQKQFAVCFINEWSTVKWNPSLHIGKKKPLSAVLIWNIDLKLYLKQREVDAMAQTHELNSAVH